MANVLIAAFDGLGGGKRRGWRLYLDDPANTSTIEAYYVDAVTEQPVASPTAFTITLTQNGGASLLINLLNGDITPGGFWDTNRNMVNDGPRTRTKVPNRLSADRAQAVEFTTTFVP